MRPSNAISLLRGQEKNPFLSFQTPLTAGLEAVLFNGSKAFVLGSPQTASANQRLEYTLRCTESVSLAEDGYRSVSQSSDTV